ncbi:hypothetical protein ACORG1_04595 [Mycobacterium sp. TJFP1]
MADGRSGPLDLREHRGKATGLEDPDLLNVSDGRELMTKKSTYVLDINAYDHDVSACLLCDGSIAVAIEKGRIHPQIARQGLLRGSDRLHPSSLSAY